MAKRESTVSETMCTICTDTKATVDMFTSSGCSHSFCTDCIANHIVAKLEDNVANVMCPEPKCEVALEPERCNSFLPIEVLERWGDALCEAMVLGMQRLFCPFVDCSATIIDDGDETEAVTVAECPCCHRIFCAQCKSKWHGEMECEEFQKLCKEKGRMDDLMTIQLAERKNWKRCPHCKNYVERIEGCSYVKCKCGSKFCYSCGDKWGGNHACPDSAHARRCHQ